LAAIVAADVAGYARLMGRDESGTLAALRRHRAELLDPAIAGHGGRLVKTMGDGLLLEFPSVVEATRCAIAVQTAMAARNAEVPAADRLVFRIGVNLGDIIIEGEDILGDGVNVAARLQAIAAPGGICIADRVNDEVRDRLAIGFADGGEVRLKHIARPVHVWRWDPGATPAVPHAAAEPELALPDRPSIAVLPFGNMSGDPEQEYFTDGITEDIITELSRFQSLFVIARNSSFSYKGKSADIRQIGRELGVRYVVEGGIRRNGNRVRVTAQLGDSLTGNQVWSERYDRVLEDLFAVQEEVTECIVAAIAPHIDTAESLRTRRRPGNLSAYEIAVRALAHAWDAWQKSDRVARDEALRLARAALAIDPDSLLALHAAAWGQWQHVALRTVEDREAAWRDGMAAAARGIETARCNRCHGFKALLLAYAPSGARWDEAAVEAQAAYRLNPQDSSAILICAHIATNSGDPLEGIRLLERSLRINPRDPFAFHIYTDLAFAHLAARDYRKGLEWSMRARSEAPDFPAAHLYAAALHVGLGEMDKAKVALDTARRLAPELVQVRLRCKSMHHGNEVHHRYDSFLRIAAGLEEPAATTRR